MGVDVRWISWTDIPLLPKEGRNGAPAMTNQEFITIAKVIKVQGRVGEVLTELFTDFPEKFEERRSLFAWLPSGERRELKLEDHWPHKGGMVLKFEGVDSIEDAERLKAAEIQIPAEDRTKLEDGSVYVSDLLECSVIVDGREIGRVKDVDFGAGEAPLLVIKGNKEYLIPFVEAFVKEQDLKGKRIEMQLPEGMLELDKPLTNRSGEARHKEGE
jgi:16S rRNA processing protein RimM